MTIRNGTVRDRAGSLNGLPGKPYRRFGNPDWDPAKQPPPPSGPQQRQEDATRRLERFTALRAEGNTIAQAATAVGIARSTAKKYERRRKAAAGGKS